MSMNMNMNMKCKHPDHTDKHDCKDRAVACDSKCACCLELEKMLTIDQAIIALEGIRAQSNLGGETVLHICVNGIEYVPVKSFFACNDESGRAVALIMSDLCDDDFVDKINN